MIEQRKFHRVSFSAKSELRKNNCSYQGTLENISLSGALVRFDPGIVVPQGWECVLTVYLEVEPLPLTLVAVVIHATNALAGIKFVSSDEATMVRLARLVERETSEPDRLSGELERIKGHFATYLDQK